MIDKKLKHLEDITYKEINLVSSTLKENMEIIEIISDNISLTWNPWHAYYDVYDKEIIQENRDDNFWKRNRENMKVNNE